MLGSYSFVSFDGLANGILSDELQVSPPEIRLWGDLHGHVAAKP